MQGLRPVCAKGCLTQRLQLYEMICSAPADRKDFVAWVRRVFIQIVGSYIHWCQDPLPSHRAAVDDHSRAVDEGGLF